MDHQKITDSNFKVDHRYIFICEVHKDLYDMVLDGDIDRKRALALIELAYDMGIKMSKKLHEYAGVAWYDHVFPAKDTV
jgi:hypothetical protein